MSSIRRYCCDDETGEFLNCSVDGETGETYTEIKVESAQDAEHREKPDNTSEKRSEKYMKFPRGYMSKTRKFQSLKANILAGSNEISHRMLLIPTLMIFPGLFCVFLMILEIYLHVNCHRKNKLLKNPNMYYRSPFHVVTSTFCGVCRESDSASRIGQLQDKRKDRYDYFRGIAI